jgi:hypothetical protein
MTVDEIRRTELEQLIAELDLGNLALQSAMGGFEERWHILDIIAPRYPEGCTLEEIVAALERTHPSQPHEVGAQVALLVHSGYLTASVRENQERYTFAQHNLTLPQVPPWDLSGTTQHCRAAVKWLVKEILPALQRKEGKLLTSSLLVPRGMGRRFMEELATVTRDKCQEYGELTGEDHLKLVVGISLTES